MQLQQDVYWWSSWCLHLPFQVLVLWSVDRRPRNKRSRCSLRRCCLWSWLQTSGVSCPATWVQPLLGEGDLWPMVSILVHHFGIKIWSISVLWLKAQKWIFRHQTFRMRMISLLLMSTAANTAWCTKNIITRDWKDVDGGKLEALCRRDCGSIWDGEIFSNLWPNTTYIIEKK